MWRKIRGTADGPSVTRKESAGPACRHVRPHCVPGDLEPHSRAVRRERAGGAIPRHVAASPRAAAWSSPRPFPPGRHHPTLTPPNASHTRSDRSIYCKEGEAPAWLCEKGTGGKVPSVLHPLKSLPYPKARQPPVPSGSWLRPSRCPREPPRTNKPMSVKERRQMQPGHCSRHLQRSGISPSMWCLLVASLTSCTGCAEASDHSSPTHLAHEPLPGTKGDMAQVQHSPGGETGPEK